MRSLPNILPSVKFPKVGNVSCFSRLSCFTWKMKRGKFQKKLLDKNGPYYFKTCQSRKVTRARETNRPESAGMRIFIFIERIVGCCEGERIQLTGVSVLAIQQFRAQGNKERSSSNERSPVGWYWYWVSARDEIYGGGALQHSNGTAEKASRMSAVGCYNNCEK